MTKKARELLEIRILDEYNTKIYSSRIPTSDRKKLVMVFSFLYKYGIDVLSIAKEAEVLNKSYKSLNK